MFEFSSMLARPSVTTKASPKPLLKLHLGNLPYKPNFYQQFIASHRRNMATASRIELDTAAAGVYHVPNITSEAGKVGSRLLQENHDKYHMFYDTGGFHNHIAHHLLTLYALGATPEEIQQGFDHNKTVQRPQYPVKNANVENMDDPEKFKGYLGKEQYFHDFEAFFRKEIEAKGWESVLNEHLFGRTEHAERILGRMFAGQ